MKAIEIGLFIAFCIGVIFLREMSAPSSKKLIDETNTRILRKLWNQDEDPDIAEACDGIDFEGKGPSTIDPIVKSIRDERTKDRNLKEYLEGGELKDFLFSLSRYFFPWAVLAVLSLIAIYPTDPNQTVTLLVVIFFLACSATMIGLSITGIIYIMPLNETYSKLKCSLYVFLGEVTNGASEKYSPNETDWKGVTVFCDKATEVIGALDGSELNTIKSLKVSDKFTHTESVLKKLSTDYTAIKKRIKSPVDGTAGFELSILNDTEDTENGLFSPLYNELALYKTEIYPKIKDLKDGASNYSAAKLEDAIAAIQNVTIINEEVEKYKADIYDYTDSGNTPINISKIFMLIYYSIILACTVLTLIGVIIFVFCGSYKFAWSTNFGCCIMIGLMAFGFTVSALLFPLSAVVIEGCDMVNPDSLEEDHSMISDDAWEQIGVCLAGDGDLYSQYNLSDTLGFANQTLPAMKIAPTYYQNDDLVFPLSPYFVINMSVILFGTPDKASPETFPVDINDNFTGNCMNDHIVWHSDNCSAEETKIVSGSIDTTTESLCVPIMDLKDSDKNNLNTRYVSCITIGTQLGYLIDYYLNIKSILGGILTTVGTLTSTGTNTYFGSMKSDSSQSGVTEALKRLNTILTTTDTLEGDMERLATELIDGLNCSFLKESFSRIYNSVCEVFTQTLTSTAVYVGVSAGVTFFLLWAVICVKRRYILSRNPKIIPGHDSTTRNEI